MKKYLFCRFPAVVLALLMIQTAHSQPRNLQAGEGQESTSAKSAFEKATRGNASGPLTPNAVNTRAMRNFKQSNPLVRDEKWYTIKGGLMVKYVADSLHIRTDYDVHGQWLYTIRYYAEDKLPAHVRHTVKTTWYDYQITLIEEINLPGKEIVYVVHINLNDTWKQIRVQNGEASELEVPLKG